LVQQDREEERMADSLPSAKSARDPDDRDKVRRIVAERGLCGLANDTKWDEFIDAVRALPEWRPSYRFKCVVGPPSEWDVEWFYHLPFPMVSVEWLDVAFLQPVRTYRGALLPAEERFIDHSAWFEELLHRIGLDYRKGETMIRIFGYSPRSLELFDQ
jgi:hypothetical protein